MEYEIHPAAEIFPPMGEQEFNGLKADIEAFGLIESIVLYDGKVLDGRHRLRACRELGIEPRFEVWPNSEPPESYVVSKNLHRRHLNTSQRAMVAARMADLSHGGDRKSDQAINRPLEKTQAEVAKELNVGEATVRRAKRVLREGTPEDISAVDRGEKTVDGVVAVIKNTKPAAPRNLRVASRVQVPEELTMEGYCRQGMAMEKQGLSTEEVALKLGMNGQSYRMARDVIVLSDRDDLSTKDAEAVQVALGYINRENRVSKIYDTVKPIVQKIWGTKPRNVKTGGRSIEKRLTEFEHALHMLVDMSRNLDQIEIPHLDDTHQTKALGHVKEAERNTRQFRNKLEGFEK